MRDLPADWTLVGFLEGLDVWTELEHPSDDVRLAATAWVLTRSVDPYLGVQREMGFVNLWFGPVPGTASRTTVVACAYWIEEGTGTVRCDSFATLDAPL